MSDKLSFSDQLSLLCDYSSCDTRQFALPLDAPDRNSRLHVVQAQREGRPILVVGNDAERSGGAVGIIEAAWLALAVLYTFQRDIPLYILHDGVGADISEGTDALDWGAAFLGSLAITDLRDGARVRAWIDAHPQAEYFQSVLRDFEQVASCENFQVHHYYVGRSVGVQSLAGAVAGTCTMSDPNAYRVLLAAPVVRLLTGEETTNVELNQAAHTEVAMQLPSKMLAPYSENFAAEVEQRGSEKVCVLREQGVQDVAALQCLLHWHHRCREEGWSLELHSDSPGLTVGTAAEASGIQYWSGQLIRAIVQHPVPATVRIVGGSYGGRYIQAYNPMLGIPSVIQLGADAQTGVLPESIVQQFYKKGF